MTVVLLAALGWGVAVAVWADGRRRAVLVARAAHELRGPLTAARLGLQLALGGGGTGPLTAVELELERAGRALADLAAAPAGRRASDRVETVDLGALVGEAVIGWQPFADRHGASLTFAGAAPDAWVRGDRARLAQACGNLLANAAEHGGGRIVVSVRRRGDRVLLDVEDGGPGLEHAVGTLVRGGRRGTDSHADPLGTLVRRARHRRGARGHGLAVAAEVAARHGGRLAGAPSPRGARIILDLPAVAVAARPAGEAR
jgi:signal transduction histidine kinase